MNALVPVLFNLLGNAVLSFLFALAFSALAQHLLRLRPGPLRLALWLVPPVKVLWDLGRGIPAQSFVWVHALGAKQDLGIFRVGFGVERARPPMVQAVLSARSAGATYSQSASDLLYRALSIKLSPLIPAALVVLVLAVAALRLARRARQLLALRAQTRKYLERATLHVDARGAWRTVPVYLSEDYGGAPFTAGLAHPFVLFSNQGFAALSREARVAAIAHELAHVERFDPLLISLLLMFGDLFWFLPGVRSVQTRVLAEIELCADARAVRRGACPEDLADALVRIGETLQPSPASALGLTGEKSLLRRRVERLCSPLEHRSFWRRLAASCAVALLFATVLHSVFFGN